MVNNFWSDLAQAQKVEQLALDVFASLTDSYTFYNVSGEREYFHKGDLIAIGADGRKVFLEIKDDSRIGETHNLLCEEQLYFHERNEWRKGNFYSDYQIYCVVSQDLRKIYIMDFAKLKAHYKSGKWKQIKHEEQTTYCYLCSLEDVRSWGAMIAEIEY